MGGGNGRQYYPVSQPPTLSCFMGCTVAAHSESVERCKATCSAAQWSVDPCVFKFDAANVTFDLCGQCPAGCASDPWTGQFVGDGECEQACDFTFGCVREVSQGFIV